LRMLRRGHARRHGRIARRSRGLLWITFLGSRLAANRSPRIERDLRRRRKCATDGFTHDSLFGGLVRAQPHANLACRAPVPQRDAYHSAVRNALVKDAWTITHDPLTIPFGAHNVFVDLGAERIIAAERGSDRIAVEIKSFAGPSEVFDIE